MSTDQDRAAHKAPQDCKTPGQPVTPAITLGLGRFRVMSEHEHRLALERDARKS